MEKVNSPLKLSSKKSSKSLGGTQNLTMDFKSTDINSIFAEIYERRRPDYFENKLNNNQSNTPISYFMTHFCDNNFKDLVHYSNIKTCSSENYYVFITINKFILTKDFEDPCSVNFCVDRNPIVLKIDLLHIEHIILSQQTKNPNEENLMQICVSSEAVIKGNLVYFFNKEQFNF